MEMRIERPIGRAVETDLIVEVLTSHRTVSVTGNAGVGKSMVLREVRRRLVDSGAEVILISGMESTSVIPLAPLLRLCPPGVNEAGPAIIAELYRRSRGGSVAVVVDDAHLLDAATAAVVRQLASADAFGLVVATRDGEDVPASIESIPTDGIAVEVRLEPLARGASDEMARRMLGDTTPAALDWIWRQTQGNPLYLRELIVAGRQTGGLRLEGGRWAPVDVPVWTSRLHALVARRLADLTPVERIALRFVTLAGQLPIEVLGSLADPGVVYSLEGRGMIRLEDGSAEVDHPMYGSAVLAATTAEQANEARLEVSAALSSSEGADPVTIATLLLDAGADVNTELLTRALGTARSSRMPAQTERFAHALLSVQDDPEITMTMSEALVMQRRWDEAASRFASVFASSEPDDRADLAMRWVMINWEYREGLTATQKIFDQLSALVGEDSSWEALGSRIGMFRDNLNELISGCDEWLARHPTSSPARDVALVTALTAGWHLGLLHRALAFIDEFGRRPEVPPTEQARVDGVMLQCHYWLGGPRRTAHLGAEILERALEIGDPEVELLARMDGIALNDLTCHTEALPHLRKALEVDQYVPGRRHYPHMMAEIARAAASCQDALPEAQQAMQEVRSLPEELMFLAQPVAKLAEATIASRSGVDPGPALREGLEHARRRSAKTQEILILRELAQRGQARDVLGDIEGLANEIDGEYVSLILRETRGLAGSEPDSLDQLAVDSWEFGARGLAADAAARASDLHAAKGEMRAAMLSRLRSDAIVDGRPLWTLARSEMEGVLSDRELDVVNAVGRGASNREVADRLFLSHRTVESHLRRIYRRIGLDGRDDLVDLVSRSAHQPLRVA